MSETIDLYFYESRFHEGYLGNSERGFYTQGKLTSNSERGLYLAGKDTGDSERSLYVHGKNEQAGNRGLWINGNVMGTSVRNFWMNAVDNGIDLYRNLQIVKDNAIIKNRVYVRGGTYLSDSYTITQIADGEQTVFWLPEKPYELEVSEGATSKTVGTKFIHSSDDYDYLVNFQEKYVEATVAPTADTVMTFTFKYDIPVLVAIEDPDSIEAYGQLEYVIFDKNIRTVTQARERALAELTDYADTMISGSFQTEETGFMSGQYMLINIPVLGIDDEFFVSRVVAKSIGGGNFIYTVYVTSATVKGIINFLIGLLESDKEALSITGDETVDEISIQTPEEFTIDDDTPVLTDHDGDYQWDDAEWNMAAWKKPT